MERKPKKLFSAWLSMRWIVMTEDPSSGLQIRLLMRHSGAALLENGMDFFARRHLKQTAMPTRLKDSERETFQDGK